MNNPKHTPGPWSVRLGTAVDAAFSEIPEPRENDLHAPF